MTGNRDEAADGLSKREHMATQILIGLTAGCPNVPAGQTLEQQQSLCRKAVRMADMLLAELAK